MVIYGISGIVECDLEEGYADGVLDKRKTCMRDPMFAYCRVPSTPLLERAFAGEPISYEETDTGSSRMRVGRKLLDGKSGRSLWEAIHHPFDYLRHDRWARGSRPLLLQFTIPHHRLSDIAYIADTAKHVKRKNPFAPNDHTRHHSYHLEPGIVRVERIFHLISDSIDPGEQSFLRLDDVTSEF